jgi:hypothetical protein
MKKTLGILMRAKILAAAAALLVLTPLAAAQNFPHIKIGMYNLGASYVPESTHNQVLNWEANHTDFLIGGLSQKSLSENNIWITYKTMGGFYLTVSFDSTVIELRNFSDANGYEFENFFLHMKQDYTVTQSNWSGMDRFDAFDNVNGVIADNGGTLMDRTSQAYSTTAADVSFTSNLYIGYGMPFAEMNFILSTPASGLSGEWQYWNGAGWTHLAVSDGTGGFTQNGKVSFLPPSDWSRTSVSGSLSKYFLRYHVNSASTLPVISRIYGDDWMTGAKCRGWNASDTNVINSGELAFNPSPPENATAKFRYQARVTGYWSPNQVATNGVYVVGGKRVWFEFQIPRLIANLSEDGYDGIMFDSLGGPLTLYVSSSSFGNNPENYSDFVDYTSNNWSYEALENYNYVKRRIQEILPGTLVGGNANSRSYGEASDFLYREYAAPPASGGAMAVATIYTTAYMFYDNYLPANNPNGSFGVFMQNDVINAARGAFWDRSNRGPIAALASHYIAMNDNTYLHYYSEGGWRYDETDEIFLYDDRTTTLTQDLAYDNSSATKYIYGADFSAFSSSGSRKVVKIGDNAIVGYTKVNDTTLSTTEAIYYNINAGAAIKFSYQPLYSSEADRMSNHTDGDYPMVEDVYRWANYFPAMFVDIGQPDPAGWNGGTRGLWQKDGRSDIFRRDFTKAIAILKMAYYNTNTSEMDGYSPAYDLGGTYYPIRADGRFESPVTSIRLRAGEGAILFKEQFANSSCIHTSEIPPCDGCIDGPELDAFIGRWYLDSSDPTLKELMEAIGLWKHGGCA